MSLLTAVLTRVPGLALIVVLSVQSAASPTQALGAPGDPDQVGVWPLEPRPEVVAGFDPPLDPWGSGHRGADLLGSAGQSVRAALPGRVAFAGTLAGRGVVVVAHVDGLHRGTRTTYEPVSADVSVGDTVAAGAHLGRLQTFGSHCFPRACLHWGWLRGEIYLDPVDLVGGGPVRLLPLWRDDPRSPVGPLVATSTTSGYSPWPFPLLRLLNPIG